MKSFGFFFALIFGIATVISNPPADLRPKEWKTVGIADWRKEAGRSLLSEMARTHGMDSYLQHQYQRISFRNTWQLLPGRVFRPWPENDQLLEMNCTIGEGEFTSEVSFRSGSNAGEIWGVDNRQSYKKSAFAHPPQFDRNPDRELWLATFQFLFEAPFRLNQAEIVAFMGDETLEGIAYHKVFLTWGQEAASMKSDQMVAWINASNMRLEKLHYTCRDSGFGFFSATIHYEDFHRVEGVLESHRQYITYGGPELKMREKNFPLHEIHWEGNSSFYP